MIAWVVAWTLLACQLAVQPGERSIVYSHVPQSAVRVSVFAWRERTRPSLLNVRVLREGSTVTLSSALRGMVIVQFARADGAYLLDGPFAWPAETVERAVDARWRRTITGTSDVASVAPVALASDSSLAWLPADLSLSESWPACWRTSVSEWECMGLHDGGSGVVLDPGPSWLMSAVVSTGNASPMRASAWGRLLAIRDEHGQSPPGVRVTVAKAVAPAQRLRGLRLDTVAVSDIRAVAVEPGLIWLTGHASPPQAWVDVRGARHGPVYLPLEEVSATSPQLPLHVRIAESRTVSGVVTGAANEPAGASLMTLFRMIEPPPRADDRAAPRARRVLSGETLAGKDGRFAIEGVGEGEYELVAWHPQFGRASVAVPARSTDLIVHLQSPGLARGRVLAGGKPAANVDVISMPDPAAFQAADDPLDVKGGDARTSTDGRFSISLAPGGGGELRVGGGSLPIKRIPLPRAPLPLVDVGDIDLGTAIDVTILLDAEPGCVLRATGPVGRSGLQIVNADRTPEGTFRLIVPEAGTWGFSLVCGGSPRVVTPAVAEIAAANHGKEIRLVVK